MSVFKQDHPEIASILYNETTKKYDLKRTDGTVEQVTREELRERYYPKMSAVCDEHKQHKPCRICEAKK